ncbi:MAG TPA: transglutaminaseTgpA domain-containing protein [Thermoanaerobaculia bacterium]
MSRRGREIEMLLLAMFAAVPLYFTYAVGKAPLIIFHLLMSAITLRVALGRGPEVVPQMLMRVLAFGYIGFYIIDAAVISRSAIAASTHLVLFIAAYQPVESLQRNNLAQRLLTTGLIFIASLATSTHISIALFLVVFGFFMFRQMIYVSHMETIRSVGQSYSLAPASRAAGFYIAGTIVIGALLFPLLPRLRNPMVQGMLGALQGATTGLSESIDFSEARTSSPDPAIVARVWMSPDAIPFFTPLRLRGAVYDSYSGTTWLQTSSRMQVVRRENGVHRIARPLGFSRAARVQQTMGRTGSRLYIPAGTYALSGLQSLYRGSTRESYFTSTRSDAIMYEASLSRTVEPLRNETARVPPYPASQRVRALGQRIMADAQGNEQRAAVVERYLLENFEYVLRPEDIGRARMSLDEFLLTVRRGHCEYFAAGMVALLSTADVPARIVGGFYGGRLNPLTGYFVVRREDAHAWVEVWNGSRWVTYDPTPPSQRPGSGQSGIGAYMSALADSASFFWDRYVLTYGLGDQVALAVELITRARAAIRGGRQSIARAGDVITSAAAIPVAAAVIGAVVLAWAIALRRRSPFELLARHMRAFGIEVEDAATMEEALARLRDESPEAAAKLAPLIALYEEEQFSGRRDPERRRMLRRKLNELRA